MDVGKGITRGRALFRGNRKGQGITRDMRRIWRWARCDEREAALGVWDGGDLKGYDEKEVGCRGRGRVTGN